MHRRTRTEDKGGGGGREEMNIDKPPVTNDLLDGWEISPSDDSRFDSLFIPIEKDPEGEEAKSKAIDVLEYLWDDAESLETINIVVTLKRTKIHKNDYDFEGSDI
jgi:hypothetical protein